MMKSIPEFKAVAILLLSMVGPAAWPSDLLAPECRQLIPAVNPDTGPAQYHHGLLWKISKDGIPPNYLFGTIHVTDDRILELPDPVSATLRSSRVFVMETVPDVNQILLSSNRMFYSDGTSLEQQLSGIIYAKTVSILSAYNLPAESVAMLKPWAAFLTMNYPPETGTILDLELLRLARENKARVHGLETMDEQIDVLDHLKLPDQLRLLIDTVCHYDTIVEEFEMLKTLYLRRDLRGLVEYSNRYTVADDAAYQTLIDALLTKRNHTMAAAMRKDLDQGGAFIAIGVMHLPGEEGVLQLLAQQYEITVVY
ncbi:MAG: hypothetical protein HW386_398 [Gammaproteobacteria bacterium]|nr:hypothetical protein [Gammaproteobacteria bacterium]